MRRISAAEAAKLGAVDVEQPATPRRMTVTEAQAAGAVDLEPPAEPKPGRSGLQTFLLNAADAASIVGIPRALAAGEALKETFTGSGDEGIVDRYHRKVKENAPIAAGMDADLGENTGAALAGQLSTALIPGPKLGLAKSSVALLKQYPKLAKLAQFAGRGAVVGGIHGAAAGGADTSGGDLAGTAVDALQGAALGAGADILGAGAGKVVEGLGDMAGRRLRGDVLKRAKSIIGKVRQQKGEAGNALDRLEIMDELKKAGAAAPGNLPTTPARRMINKFPNLDTPLRGARVGNAAKDFGQFERNLAKYGPRGVPGVKQAKEMATSELERESSSAMRNLLLRSGGAVVGAQAGKMGAEGLGLDPTMGAIVGGLAGGGGSNFYLARKTTGAVLGHPKLLRRIAQVVPGFGRALQVGGRTMAETVLANEMRRAGFKEELAAALQDETQDAPGVDQMSGDQPVTLDATPDEFGTDELDENGEPTLAAKRRRFRRLGDTAGSYPSAPTGGDL